MITGQWETIMEIALDASVLILLGEQYFSWEEETRPPLRECSKRLQTYTGGKIGVFGEIDARVSKTSARGARRKLRLR